MDKIFFEKAENVLSLLNDGDNVTVALSGGADSVFLLHMIYDFSHEVNINVKAVHVNHNIRGKEADRDENFCRKICYEMGINLDVRKVNAVEFSEKNGYSLEEGSRILRYEIFEGIKGYVATAHNLNDRAETVIFNMARGTGLKGLCSIPYMRKNVIRPLLNISRKEIEEYLAQNGISYVNDSTNFSNDYSRNKIRHKILPVMGEINEMYLSNIGRMTENLISDEDFLESEAQRLTDDATVLCNAHPALRRRYLKKRLEDLDITPDKDKILRLENTLKNKTYENISGNVFSYVGNGKLIISERENFESVKIPLKFGINEFVGGKAVILEKNNFQNFNIVNKIVTNFTFDYGKIQGVLYLRTLSEGDRIQLKGENFHRKIRKVYNEKKIPVKDRKCAVILEDDGGIVYAEYCGLSERVFPYETSETVNLTIMT